MPAHTSPGGRKDLGAQVAQRGRHEPGQRSAGSLGGRLQGCMSTGTRGPSECVRAGLCRALGTGRCWARHGEGWLGCQGQDWTYSMGTDVHTAGARAQLWVVGRSRP